MRNTLLAWLVFISIFQSSQSSAEETANKYVGVLYAVWFNEVNKAGPAPIYPSDVAPPGFRYWGEPASGRYLTFNGNYDVINRHADDLAAAGVDFIMIDFSNGPLINNPADYVDSTKQLISTYAGRVLKGIPTPKIVFLMPGDNHQVQLLYATYYQPYQNENVFFNYGGKPLLLAAGCNFQAASNFNCKVTSGYNLGANWSFVELSPQIPFQSGGWPEEIAVSAAQQETFMNAPSARGRRYNYLAKNNNGYLGQNFDDQWIVANQVNPTFIIVKSWNEWVAQRLMPDNFPNGDSKNQCSKLGATGCFTDEYTPEFSNDLEQMVGGHGDLFYQKMKQQVSNFKKNSPNFLFRNSASGIWYFKNGRKGKNFEAQNYFWSFAWAAGSNYQAITGDFNNDGLTDIALRDVTTGRWYFAFFNGTNYYHNTRDFQWASGSNYEPIVGDFNGDGKIDIGLRDAVNGRWYFAFFNGADYYHNTRSFDWASGSNYQPIVGDFNGDGKLDIGLRDVLNGRWYFAIFNGVDYYNNTRNFDWASGSNYQPIVGDFDCDKNLDIGLRDAGTGKIYLANYNGNLNYNNNSNYSWNSGAELNILSDALQCN